jgi:hypothetical protein
MTWLTARAAELLDEVDASTDSPEALDALTKALREAIEQAAQVAEPRAGDDYATAMRIAHDIRRELLEDHDVG